MEFFFGGTMLYWIALALLATVLPMRLVAEELRSGTIEPLLTAPVDGGRGRARASGWRALAFFAIAWAPTLLYVVYLRAVGARSIPGRSPPATWARCCSARRRWRSALLASAVTRNQLVAAALSFVAFFVALLVGALEGQVRSPALAAALRRASLFRMMEDFGHGIVDSRHVAAAGDGHRRWRCWRRPRWWRALRGPIARRCAPRAPAAGLAGARSLIAAIAVMTQILAGRHYRARRLDAGVALRAVAADGRGAASAAPAGRGDDLPLSQARLAERARARSPGCCASWSSAFARDGGRALSRPVRRSRSRSAARRGGEPAATASARTRWGRARSCSRRATRSKVVTWEDLVEPELDADGEASPALHAWRGEAAFLSALLTVTSDDPLRICFSAGHGEPDIESLEDGGYATFADELRRDGDEVRALARIGDAASAGCRVLVIAEPTQALSRAELAALRRVRRRRRAAAGDAGAGVRAATARAFAHVGLEAFAAALRRAPGRQPGRRSVARQRRRGAVGVGGRAGELPAAPADGALRRAADLLAAHARGGAARSRRCPASPSRRWCRPAPKGGARPTSPPSAATRT